MMQYFNPLNIEVHFDKRLLNVMQWSPVVDYHALLKKECLVGVTMDTQNQTVIDGFCIQVFKAALDLVPYDVPYKFELLGDGITTPKYSDLIQKLANQVLIVIIYVIHF